MVEMLKQLDKVNANFWKAVSKGRRKFWAYVITTVISMVIELQFMSSYATTDVTTTTGTTTTVSIGQYFPWYYWLFMFLTFCGVNWLDKVKWFTGEGIAKAPKIRIDKTLSRDIQTRQGGK